MDEGAPAGWTSPGGEPASRSAGTPPPPPPLPPPPAPPRRRLWIALGSSAAVVAAVLVVALVVRTPGPARSPAAPVPSTSSPTTTTTTAPVPVGPPVTLTFAAWDGFDLAWVKSAYRVVAPNVTIKVVNLDSDQVHEHLQQALDSGRGAPDVAAIDEYHLPQFRAQADRFVDLRTLPGARDRERDYLRWAWQRTLGPGGRQMAFPDGGTGNAFCYRRDLFAAAGLPTDRDAVARLWPTWQAFAQTAHRYHDKTGKPFLDNAGSLLHAVLQQQPTGYFTAKGRLSLTAPRRAWNAVLPVAGPAISAHLDPYDAKAWAAGVQHDRFAVTQCPRWRLDEIRKAVPDTRGKWDVTALPGVSGNDGSDYLAIPRQSRHVAEAWRFLNWYTAPHQQSDVSWVPMQPAALDSLTVREQLEWWFNNAPVGRIYGRSVQGLPAQNLGPAQARVRWEVEDWLWAVDRGDVSPALGWQGAVHDARKAAGQDDA